MPANITAILGKPFVKTLIRQTCGDDFEIVERPASFAIRSIEESDRDIYRLIILPPKGYTANTFNQTNSHDEAEYASVEIKGSVRDGKSGFSKLRDCLMVVSFAENGAVSELNQPYLIFDLAKKDADFVKEIRSSGEPPFPVVKSNGYGFYHNLINITDEWLVLKLYKKLRPQRKTALAPILKMLPHEEAEILEKLYSHIVSCGDEIFAREPDLIEAVTRMPPGHVLPPLTEMLYTHDTGKHEACTAFAVTLKIGKLNPDITIAFLQDALEADRVPAYYARQLIKKITKAVDSQSEAERKTA